MEALNELLRYVNIALFAGLASVTFVRWRRRRDDSARWAAVTFGVLAVVAVAGLLLPDDSDSAVVDYLRTLRVAAITLFPYLLYRIAASFRKEPHWFDRVAFLATAALVVWALVLPRIPEGDQPRPPSYQAFVVAIIAVWIVLSVVVAVRFWRGGTGQPVVARRRMRMLAVASLVLSLVIVLAGRRSPDQSAAAEVFSRLLTTASVVAFFLAFAPPHWLRQAWRRPIEESLRRGTLDLMTADTADQVMEVLLPHAIGIVGGEGIAVVDRDGKVIGSSGVEPAEIARAGDLPSATQGGGRDATGLVHLEFPFGAVVVRTGPYTPFFGQEEIELLGALGAFANLALERVAAGDLRIRLEKAELRRQQALEINDNIVQGLAVAKYSFDLGQDEKGKEAVEGTLVAARAIISELLEDLGPDMDFAPGTLTRGRAATGFMNSGSVPVQEEKRTPPDDV